MIVHIHVVISRLASMDSKFFNEKINIKIFLFHLISWFVSIIRGGDATKIFSGVQGSVLFLNQTSLFSSKCQMLISLVMKSQIILKASISWGSFILFLVDFC